MTEKLGARKLTLVLLCNIIGTGIFIIFPLLLQLTQSVINAIISLILAGTIVMAFGLCYAELGATYPQEGGDAIYLKKAYGIVTSIIYSIFSVYIILPLGAAIMLKYIFSVAKISDTFVMYCALFIVSCIIVINWCSCDVVIRVQLFLTYCKVFFLGVFMLIALLNFLNIIETRPNVDNELENNTIDSKFPLNIILGASSIFWAFDGWNAGNFIAHRVRNPSFSFPIAIIASLIIVTLIYIMFGISFMRVLSLDMIRQIEHRELVSTFFERLNVDSMWFHILTLCINIIPPLGTLNGSFLVAASIVDSFTANMKHPSLYKFIGLFLFGIVVMIGISTQKVYSLVSTISIFIYLWYGLSIVAILVLRTKDKEVERKFMVPKPLIYFVISLVPVIISLSAFNILKASQNI